MYRRTLAAAASLLAVLALAPAAPPQASRADTPGAIEVLSGRTWQSLYSVHGTAAADGFGAATSSDQFTCPGEPDLVVGAPGALPAERGPAYGRAVVLDPADGRRLAVVDGNALPGGTVRRLGESVAVLGHPTGGLLAWLALGAPASVDSRQRGTVLVFGDRALTEHYRLRGAKKALFGWRVFTLFSDVDGDAERALDFVVTAPTEGRAGRNKQRGAVYLYSVLTGNRIWRARGPGRFARFGYAAAGAGDRDDDGINDVWVSAPGSVEADVAGAVFLLSGADGSELMRIDAPNPGETFGFALANIWDRNDDGVRDLLVSAPDADVRRKGAAGRVYVISGLDGEILDEIEGRVRGQWLGTDLGSASAVAGGERRLLIGSAPPTDGAPPRAARGRLEVLAEDTRRLRTLRGSAPNARFGALIGGLRDMDEDGYLELVVAAPGAGPGFIPR